MASATAALLSVRLARGDAERGTAYRLRDDGFTCEQGDERCADHARREYRDVPDEPEAVSMLLRAWNGEDLAGRYGLDPTYHRVNAACSDRGGVVQTHRGGPGTDLLFDDPERRTKETGVPVLVGYVGAGNEGSRRLVKRRGFVPFSSEQARSQRLTLHVRDRRASLGTAGLDPEGTRSVSGDAQPLRPP